MTNPYLSAVDALETPAERDNKYLAVIDGAQARDDSVLRSSIHTALRSNPDQYAKARALSAETGLPADMVERNMDVVDRRVTTNKYAELLADSPGLAERMRDPEFAKVAHDDLDNLSVFERVKAGSQSVFDLATGFPWAVAGAVSRGLDKFNTGQQLFSALMSKYVGVPMDDVPAYVPRGTTTKILNDWSSAIYARSNKNMQAAQAGLDPVTQGIISGAHSVALNLPYQVLAVATRNPQLALIPMSLTTAGEAYQTAIDKGVSHEQALAYAGGQGLVEYATEGMPLTRFLDDLKAGSGFLKTMGTNLVLENYGEQWATHLQDLNQWATLNPEKTLGDYLRERPNAALQTLIATTFATLLQGSASYGVGRLVESQYESQTKAMTAERTKSITEQLMSAAEASKLRQRDVGAFEEAVDAATKDGPITEVLINAEKFGELYQDAAPEMLAAVGVSEEQFSEALATQGDIAIAIPKFASTLAVDPRAKPLVDHIKFAHDDMTPAEAKKILSEQQEEMTREGERILTELGADEEFRASAQRVQDQVFAQLEATKRFRPEVNRTYATLTRTFIAVQAKRMGLTPEAFVAAHPINISSVSGLPEMSLEQDQSEVIPQAIGAKKIVEVGRGIGMTMSLQVSEDGTRGAVFAHSFTRKTRNSAKATQNHDLMYAGPIADARAYWEKTKTNYKFDTSLDQRGATQQFIVGDQGEQAVVQMVEFDGKVGFKVEIDGKELGTFDDIPTAAREAQKVIGGKGIFYQTPSDQAAFDAWFKESKAVNDKGEPVIVYHGGGQDIQSFTEEGAEASPVSGGAQAFFFSDAPENASGYAEDKGTTRFEIVTRAGRLIEGGFESREEAEEFAESEVGVRYRIREVHQAPTVYPVYLSLQNPLIIDAKGANWSRIPLPKAVQKQLGIEGEKATWSNRLIAQAKRAGFDGVIIRNVIDTTGSYEKPQTTYAVFDGTSVKSIFNRGTWDATDPNILNQGPRDLGTHVMGVQRGERQVNKSATLTPEETAAIDQAAELMGSTPAAVRAMVIATKSAHPLRGKWAPLTFLGAAINSSTGKPEYKWQAIPYRFNADDEGRALKVGSAEYLSRVNALSRRMVEEVLDVYERARKGDKTAQNIISQSGWYREMRARLRQEFGGLGDLFADLLGATSPNTPVRDNWANAVDVLRRAMRGDFDALIPKWVEWQANLEREETEFRAWYDEQLQRNDEGLAEIADRRKAMLKVQASERAEYEARRLKEDPTLTLGTSTRKGEDGKKIVTPGIRDEAGWKNIRKTDLAALEKEKSKFSKKAIEATAEYSQRAERAAAARELPESLMPTKESGKKYGFNGKNVVRAMLDLWRTVREADPDIGRGAQAPKALNFSGNLIGFRDRATIDVWAARMLQRLSGLKRIPSMAETGVSGDMLPDGRTTLQFGFGQDVFAKAAAEIRLDPLMSQDENLARLNDDDLQALVWFIEKEIWTKHNWTSAAGEGGSFEFEANLTGSAAQDRIRTLRQVIDSSLTTPDQKHMAQVELEGLQRTVDRFQAGVSIQQSAGTQGVDYVPSDADMAELGNKVRLAIYEADPDHRVIGSKALATQGRYGSVERSLDLEVVTREGYDPRWMWRRILEAARDANQDSTFLSRVLRAEEDPDPTRHRPGMEIYFKSAKSGAELEQILADLAANGVEFYTISVDGRVLPAAMGGAMPPAVGVRFQYVPEYDVRYGGMGEWADLKPAGIAALMKDKAKQMADLGRSLVAKIPDVTYAGQLWYDTEVRFAHEYQDTIDALPSRPSAGADRPAGEGAWAARPLRESLESAARQSEVAAERAASESRDAARRDAELNQSPVWRSALIDTVAAAKTAKAPGPQWFATLKNAPGIKAEEMAWYGLEDWLKGRKSVTRQELLDYLKAHELEVTEVVKGGFSADKLGQYRQEQAQIRDALAAQGLSLEFDAIDGPYITRENEDGDSIVVMGGDVFPDDTISDDVRNLWSRYVEIDGILGNTYGSTVTPPDSPKFANWQLPGGENYRELLLTLPSRERKGGDPLTPEEREYFDSFTDRDVRMLPPNDIQKLAALQKKINASFNQPEVDFHGGHYDEPNVLAHVRFNDRTDADGKRVLFIEEIQSDWHQKGRKEGYDTSPASRAEYETPLKERAAAIQDTLRQDALREPASRMGRTEQQRLEAELADIREKLNTPRQPKVPDAPFKTTWPELSLKRMIRYAAENGYDRIAWTPGEVQADRYDLSKQIKSITAFREGDRYTVVAYDKGDNVVMNGKYQAEELPNVVGKELTEKIVAQKGESERTYSGLDLKVGGEGMRGFYDKILVDAANKLGKKFGAKVGRTGISAMDRKVEVEKYGDQWRVMEVYPDGQRVIFATLPSEARAKSAAAGLVKAIGERDTVAHSLDITPQMRESVMQGQPLFQQNRGAFNPATRTITLLQNADLSTFLHELGHWQLETMVELALQPNAPAQIVKDVQTLLDWFGVKDIATWRSMTLEQQREFHEKFARGFEAYLFKGESPNAELRGIFSRFRAWLLGVYKHIKALNVTLTPEVEQVFGRMLASEEEIAAAEATRGFRAIFQSQEESGMSEEEWLRYQQTGAQATTDAQEELERKSLKDMQWLANAKNRELKKLQAQHDKVREAVKAEVEAEVEREPVYAALAFLKRGILPERLTGRREDIAQMAGMEGYKLSLPVLKQMYGEGPAAPWRYLSFGPNGLAAEDGMHPDMAAELLGYDSGDALVKALLEAPPMAEVVDARTDQRMLEEHGELVDPKAVERAAEAAIHNVARAKFVAAELAALEQAMSPKTPAGKDKRGRPRSANLIVQAAKQYAEQKVAAMKIRDVRKSGRYLTAEGKAAREAEKAHRKGDFAAAVMAKRSQMLSGALYKASEKAAEEVDKTVEYLKKFLRAGTRENIDQDYLDQIDALLESVELKAVSLKELDRRQNLRDWIAKQQDMGIEPTLDPDVVDRLAKTNFADMTVEQVRVLRETIKQIEHLGRLKQKLLTAKDKREFDAVVAEMVQSVEDNSRDRSSKNMTGTTKLDRAVRLFKGFLASHRKLASLARQMDGSKDGGKLWEYFIRAMNEAGDHEATMREQATVKLAALIQPLMKGPKMGGKGEYIRELLGSGLGPSLNREQRIAVALNVGNAGNLQRLMSGYALNRNQLDAILNRLTKEDWDFVQSIWDLFDSYRPEIAEKEKRVMGSEPDWVEPTPVQTRFGEYRGGYYPVKYDPLASQRAEEHADAEDARLQMRAAYTSATTRRSFVKPRANEVMNRPLLLTFGGIYQGLNEVIHDLAWHEWVIDANRLIKAPALNKAIRDTYGAEIVQQFKKGIEDIARGDVPAQQDLERVLNHLRTGSTVVGLGWNVMTSLLQPLGLTQSMVRIGPKWVAKGIGDFVSRPLESLKEVYSKSEFMRVRAKTMQREINEIQNTIGGGKGKVRSAVEASFFMLIQKTQLGADVPTWLGAYEKAISEGNDEARSVSLADQAVIDSQGGGQIKDLALVQRGGPLQKLFTNFYSYFNLTYNLAAESARRTDFRKPKDVGALAVDYLLLMVLPSVLGTLLRAAVSPDDDDEEELARKVIGDQISYLFGLMVGLREVTSFAQYATGTKVFSTTYSGPAGARFFSELEKFGKQVGQGELDAALFRSGANVAGILLHWPTGQVVRTVEGAAALIDGKTEDPRVLLTGYR